MSYPASATRLRQIFQEHDYAGLQKNGSPKKTITVEQLSNGSSVQVVFPGYKKTGVDYRVELVKNGVPIPLSHMNIIVDLVNKTAHQNMDVDKLRAALEKHAVEGRLDYVELANTLLYQQNAPSRGLLNRVGNRKGNEHDLSVEELFSAIHWIALQEDFNYSIASGRDGRKMPYYRYLEALHGVKHGRPTLEEMQTRTNFKGSPPSLLNGIVDYSFASRVK
ncbi:MAG: hypothetical protein ACRYF0_04055 [Janthinobacterium lividum]